MRASGQYGCPCVSIQVYVCSVALRMLLSDDVFCVFVPPALMDALHASPCHIHACLDGTPITDAPYPRSSSGWEEIWSGHACGHGWQASGWSLWITALVCCGWLNWSSGATTPVVFSTPQKRVHTWCIHIFSSRAVRRVVVCRTNVVILAVFFAVLHITHIVSYAPHCTSLLSDTCSSAAGGRRRRCTGCAVVVPHQRGPPCPTGCFAPVGACCPTGYFAGPLPP
jgi:hypothetical protein